jgi:hypothetical protein
VAYCPFCFAFALQVTKASAAPAFYQFKNSLTTGLAKTMRAFWISVYLKNFSPF